MSAEYSVDMGYGFIVKKENFQSLLKLAVVADGENYDFGTEGRQLDIHSMHELVQTLVPRLWSDIAFDVSMDQWSDTFPASLVFYAPSSHKPLSTGYEAEAFEAFKVECNYKQYEDEIESLERLVELLGLDVELGQIIWPNVL